MTYSVDDTMVRIHDSYFDTTDIYCMHANDRLGVELRKDFMKTGEVTVEDIETLSSRDYPGETILIGTTQLERAPAGLYELAWNKYSTVQIMKVDGKFYWAQHPTEPFMKPISVKHLVGPWRQILIYPEGETE